MSAEDNRAVVGRLWREVFGEGRVEEADGLLAPDHVTRHASFANAQRGPDALKATALLFRRLLPDLRVTVEDADEERVVVRWRVDGTLADDTPGAGDEVSIPGVGTHLFSDGRIRETRLRFGPQEPPRHGPPEELRDRLLAGLPIGGHSIGETERLICIICPRCC